MTNLEAPTIPTSGIPFRVMEIDLYDRNPVLTPRESEALRAMVKAFDAKRFNWPAGTEQAVHRLLCPLGDVMSFLPSYRLSCMKALRLMIRAMNASQVAYWGWTPQQWFPLFEDHPSTPTRKAVRPIIRAFAYLLGGIRHLPETDKCNRAYFAALIFGHEVVEAALQRVIGQLMSWGYSQVDIPSQVREILSEFFLVNGSATLEMLPTDIVSRVQRTHLPVHYYNTAHAISRALVSLGCRQVSLLIPEPEKAPSKRPAATQGIATEWVNWCQRWAHTSTHTPSTIEHHYYTLLKVGRWLAATHPDVTSPAQWTRHLAVEFVTAVNHMKVGDYVSSQKHISNVGKPLSAAFKVNMLLTMGVFIHDCQEWEWIPRTFSPEHCLKATRALKAQLKPAPRVIDDALWAKLIWAGLNLTAEDVAGFVYPFEFVRAVGLLWLFSGLRSNEIRRLRVGCVRWQNAPSTGGDASLTQTVCLLDVPANKTYGPFTKPIARVAGEAMTAWEALRPSQPSLLDLKTAEQVDYLFAYRGKPMGECFINQSLIPILCRKAGVPLQDQRGNLSSHRARATIATQLANAKDPMSLLELQQWLGHNTPLSTQYYVMVSPTRLSRAYADAGYLDRNLRAIEVLIDQEAIRSGAAASGDPWKYYDLGHGHCTYDFFDQCPHRMACARCDFYVPKDSAKAQLLQAKTNLLRMKQEIPLLEDELAALENDVAAIDRLCRRLADVPSPAGPTPRELASSTFISLNDIG